MNRALILDKYEHIIGMLRYIHTYSSFVLLVPVFLLTDFVRYKPVIVLGGVAYITTWVLLLWAKGIAAMQVMEFSYGLVTSTEVAYYTYIYAKVCKIFNSPLYNILVIFTKTTSTCLYTFLLQTSPENYQKVSGVTRGTILIGSFLSGFLSQLLADSRLLDVLDYHQLNFISLGTVSVAFLFGLLLPPVSSSIYFDRQTLISDIRNTEGTA